VPSAHEPEFGRGEAGGANANINGRRLCAGESGARQTWVMMEYFTRSGESKLVERCTYPLTGVGCLSRIYTDLAVIDVTAQEFKLIVSGLSLAELNSLSELSIAL